MNARRFGKGRRRRAPGAMNGQEREYAVMLEGRKAKGELDWISFEGVTLKLAPDTRYTPDFAVMRSDGEMEFHEVKGFMEDDAWVKLKVAAALFPFRFVLARKAPKKMGGGWTTKAVGDDQDNKGVSNG